MGFGAALQPLAGEGFYYEPNYHYQGFKENFSKEINWRYCTIREQQHAIKRIS
jgi:hypothetical protein